MGALESNAGDDFHFWWAASRALALIAPNARSRLVVVEGLAKVDDPGDEYEIADVVEYLDGSDLASASNVLISQLKHSTRHPNTAWTVARLNQKRGRSSAGTSAAAHRSVTRDLASTYGQLTAKHGREAVLQKVCIRLVSNQPGDQLLIDSLTAAAAWVREQNSPGRAALLASLPAHHADVIRLLSEGVGSSLSSRDFCDFLTVLDLSTTGTLDRAALTRSVQAAAAELTPGYGPDSGRRLFDLVRCQALPESPREGLTAAVVLAELGVANAFDLYPAPAHLTELPDPLPAPGARLVAQGALAHLGEVVIAHGAAGAGKTTAIRQMVEHLPKGSEVLLYDCYGGGGYLNAGEERHTAARFVMQVVNDLAQRCGTPLLLHPPMVEPDLWRLLSSRLAGAAEALPEGAVLVLAVDAADNASAAAAERGDRSFLPSLTTLALPPQVTVVLTSRSHRIDTLAAKDAPTVDVDHFDLATSATHLRRHRPDASEADTTTFHQRTGGNPRVQFYVLSQSDVNTWGMIELLEACTRTPEPLFADLVESALRGSGASEGGQRWLAVMLALARPVSVDTIARALQVDGEAVAAFAAGLTPGVHLEAGAIQFRDEDFETYVRGRVDPTDVKTAHGHLADMFLASRAADADAAAQVAEHLSAADRHEELLTLVLEEDTPRGIADGFRREQVQGRRLDLSVRAAAVTDDAAVAVQIAARACDTASRSDTLSRLVENRLDLVARYADIDQLRAYALRQSRGSWLGPTQMRLAAALSRSPATHPEAREALESAAAWVQRWMDGREGETRNWDLDADDLAAAAEAGFRLDGLDTAIAMLRRWEPRSFVLEAAAALAARTAGEVETGTIRAALEAAGVPPAQQAPFLAVATLPLMRVDPEWIDAVVDDLTCHTVEGSEPWHDRLLEVVMRQGNRGAIEALAAHWAQELPTSEWAFRAPTSAGVRGLRCHALRAALAGTDLDVAALVPPSLLPIEAKSEYAKDPRGHERREWLSRVQALAPMVLLGARVGLGEDIGDAVITQVESAVSGRLAQAGHRWFKYDKTFHSWAVLAAGAVADSGAPASLLERIADAAPTLVDEGAPELWLDLADVLAARPQHSDEVLQLCVRAAEGVRTSTLSAPERLDVLSRAADIAGKIAPVIGRGLFDRAVETATGINDDAARLLSVHADLARRATLQPEQRTRVANHLIQAAEDIAPHVSDADVVPYQELAGAASHLDAAIGLAAVSRWDDEARLQMRFTLSAALLGAVDGGALTIDDALALDHLIEDDVARLGLQLALIDRFPDGELGKKAARRATSRATSWLRRHVPTAWQASFAGRMLKEAPPRAIDAGARFELDATHQLALTTSTPTPTTWSGSWAHGESASEVQALLEGQESKSWTTLTDDVAFLDNAHVSTERQRSFIAAVLHATPSVERLSAINAVTKIAGRNGEGVVFPVLADFVGRWRAWPGIRESVEAALPSLLREHLADLVAFQYDIGRLLGQLRVLADDNTIRRALLAALPESRPRLTAHGWQNIASLLGQLCPPTDAARAVIGLLSERESQASTETASAGASSGLSPLVMLLWSALGNPRRQVRWRAAHAIRDLLTRSAPAHAAELTGEFMRCLAVEDLGRYRSPDLPFYYLSAYAALLTALSRVAADKPDLFVAHLETFTRIASSRDLPHAQIRELARSAALPVRNHLGLDAIELRLANRPVACALDREQRYSNDRIVSEQRRYRFDSMDTIPYWYAPLARLFGLETDTIAERAERWIVDEWTCSESDWLSDVRELRDERSYRQMHNDHGAIPPEENLRLYLEYHAMLLTAGELIDAGAPVHIARWSDEDPWWEWLLKHLPSSPALWLSDLRAPVPLEAELFGHLPALDEWDVAPVVDYDRALGLTVGDLPEKVLVAGVTSIYRPGASGDLYVASALVSPEYARDLQRALAAATDPRDYKLPDEGEKEHEIGHGKFTLRGWMTNLRGRVEATDEHDPYAHDLSLRITLPGERFRQEAKTELDPTGMALRSGDGKDVARAQQWSDPPAEETQEVTTSGYRVHIQRDALLQHLRKTGTNLIVEVQIGRHRRGRDRDDYRPPRSRIYLIDATGTITAN